MPRQLFINGRFLSQPITGVQRYASEVVKALDRLATAGRLAGVEDWGISLLIPHGLQLTSGLERIALREVGRFSGHLWEQLELPIASRGGLLLNLCNTAPIAKRRQIVTLHDAAVLRAPAVHTWAFRTWYRVLWNILARTVPSVLTVSDFSRQELSACLGRSRDRIGKVQESGEHILNMPADRSILKQHAIGARPYALAVSTAHPNKNFGAVVRAIELIGDAGFDFVVAGGVDPRVFKQSAAALPTSVKHVGYVSDAQLRALYENAACFVYPSLYEGFGLPPLEAMTCGCPVIASNAASLPEVCGDAALYVDPESFADIASKLRQLMANEPRRKDLAIRGRRRAKQFSWRRAALQNWDEVVAVAGSKSALSIAGRHGQSPGADR